MDWTGFSDEDLRRLKNSSSPSNEANGQLRSSNIRVRQADLKRNARPQHKPVRSTGESHERAAETLPATQRLSRPIERNSPPVQSLPKVAPVLATATSHPPVTSDMQRSQMTQSAAGKVEEKCTPEQDIISVDGKEPGMELDENSILTKELASLDKFREQQKMMEELNKRKKQMLTTAIQQRQSKAKAEATKLTYIKRELEHLDQLITTDVSLIRDKIEIASREFLDAQKRYERAEKEFIEAKIDLHGKSDSKDRLTEHLYTVIHQNEMRKAKKLAELMEKLEMESADGEDTDIQTLQPAPVPLCLITPLNRHGMVLAGTTSPTTAPPIQTSPAIPGTTDESNLPAETKQPCDDGSISGPNNNNVVVSDPISSVSTAGVVADKDIISAAPVANCDAHGEPCKDIVHLGE